MSSLNDLLSQLQSSHQELALRSEALHQTLSSLGPSPALQTQAQALRTQAQLRADKELALSAELDQQSTSCLNSLREAIGELDQLRRLNQQTESLLQARLPQARQRLDQLQQVVVSLAPDLEGELEQQQQKLAAELGQLAQQVERLSGALLESGRQFQPAAEGLQAAGRQLEVNRQSAEAGLDAEQASRQQAWSQFRQTRLDQLRQFEDDLSEDFRHSLEAPASTRLQAFLDQRQSQERQIESPLIESLTAECQQLSDQLEASGASLRQHQQSLQELPQGLGAASENLSASLSRSRACLEALEAQSCS